MSPSRIWALGAGVAIVGIFAGAGLLGIQPRLAAASAADAATATSEAQNWRSTAEITRLARAAARQSELESTQNDLDSAVPSTFRMNSFSKMLRDAAAFDGVAMVEFAPAVPMVYAPPLAASSAAAAGASPSASAAPAPAAATSASWFGVNDPAITAADFSVIPVTVSVKGPASGVVAFAAEAQRQRRLFAVTTVTTQFDKTDGSTTGVITGYVYTLKP